ncbi:MAG: type II secretion system protein [Desulfobacterales bacterium]|nr:type II secretion system protein [Desulfobacterales bacterium]
MPLTKKNSGYTLIELVVVISLISIMLFFAIPRFHDTVLTDNTKKFSRWLITTVRSLKAAAVRDQKRYNLNVDLDAGKLWVTSDGMSEEERQTAENAGYSLPEDVRIIDMEFPFKGKITGGQVEISFYKADYSDKVMIHIENSSRKQMSFLIEPFLSGVKLYEKYVGFEI